MFYTVWFEANGLRPDYARFDTESQAEQACSALINDRFAGRPLRIRVSHKGVIKFVFDRERGLINRGPAANLRPVRA